MYLGYKWVERTEVGWLPDGAQNPNDEAEPEEECSILHPLEKSKNNCGGSGCQSPA